MFLFRLLFLVFIGCGSALAQTNPGFIDGCPLGASTSPPCLQHGGLQPTLNSAFTSKQDALGFTPGKVFNVANFGAVGDGVTDDTSAFANTLSACGTAGGGQVILGPNRYLINSGNLTVPSRCKVLCQAPLLGSRGATQPINFATVVFVVLLNPSFTITLNPGSGWQGCAVLNSTLNFRPVTTRDLLNNTAVFAGTAFSVGGDVSIDDTSVFGFSLGITGTVLGAPRLRINRMNIDATQCAQFDNIHDIPYIWALHCFPFLDNGNNNSDPSYAITGVADNGLGSHLYRVTVSAPTTIQTGDNVWVTNQIVGANSAVGRWIATVIDTTHVDLQGSTTQGATPTGNNVSGSTLLTGLSSMSGIGVGSTVTGTGVPASTIVLSVLYTCNCVIVNKASTSTNTGITFTFADNAYSSGGNLFLAADWRSGIGIEFTNTDRAICIGCYAFNHNIGLHIGTLAQWIMCTGCTLDNAGMRDPKQIGVLIDSTAKAASFVDSANLATQNAFVVNSNANNTPHMITGSTVDAAQGINLLELDSGAMVMTGDSNGNPGKWISMLDAATALSLVGNDLQNFFSYQSATSQAKVISQGNISAHTTTAPTATSCGTGPAVDSQSTDFDGIITEGTTATGCTVTFHQGFSRSPSCVVAPQASATLTSFAYTVGANAITITHGSASNGLFNWHCFSRDGL
jgi:hypothetical protein